TAFAAATGEGRQGARPVARLPAVGGLHDLSSELVSHHASPRKEAKLVRVQIAAADSTGPHAQHELAGARRAIGKRLDSKRPGARHDDAAHLLLLRGRARLSNPDPQASTLRRGRGEGSRVVDRTRKVGAARRSASGSQVAVLMGSKSDLEVMRPAAQILAKLA